MWRSLVSRLVRVQEASGSNPDTPTKKLESAFAGSSFLIGVMGFERPLRKHAGGIFLGRGRVLPISDASGTDVDGIGTFTYKPIPIRVSGFFAV